MIYLAIALLLIDWRQTRYISQHPANYTEINRILGAHPTLGRVNVYFGLCVAGTAGLSLIPYGWTLQAAIAILEAVVTYRNYKLYKELS